MITETLGCSGGTPSLIAVPPWKAGGEELRLRAGWQCKRPALTLQSRTR
jgi:hypothetical protein